ncbi:MAG: DNA ligase [Psychrosphaera sp.]|nr:DNA ligase [Psychrosphaera sp.]
MRAYWDGKQLVSRQGNVFWAPQWFVEDFPTNVPLDGELWTQRSQFERVSGIVRQKRADNRAWRSVKFMIFDYPGSKAVFSKRIELMKAAVEQADSPYLRMIKQERVGSDQALNDWLDVVVANGGEGLMLHRGLAVYQARRRPDLMKLKIHFDAEAVVLDHLPGKGKFTGILGALLVRDDHGIVFKIGSGFSNAQRANPPAVGSTITFKYYGKTRNNVPRFASFMRVRVRP